MKTQLNDYLEEVKASVSLAPISFPYSSVFTTDDVLKLIKDIQLSVNRIVDENS